MSRSKSGICVSTTLRAVLAAIVPRDDQAEDDVQSAERGAEEKVGDGEREEGGGRAEEHEADAHHGNHADGKRAAADERRAVKQEPHRRERVEVPAAHYS